MRLTKNHRYRIRIGTGHTARFLKPADFKVKKDSRLGFLTSYYVKNDGFSSREQAEEFTLLLKKEFGATTGLALTLTITKLIEH
nr:hypothetical protein [uncultured Desulfuromonas sp.]